ncbi:MAG: hypothetical protein K2N87_15855 [Eubacterium sp.]|nr:hypothetical protein [Eubacterium sp.]
MKCADAAYKTAGYGKRAEKEAVMESFQEAYTQEMNRLRCSGQAKEAAFARMRRERGRIAKKRSAKKRYAAAAAVLCLVFGIANSSQIAGFAKELSDSFFLSAGKKNTRHELDAIAPVAFDVEGFCRDAGTQADARYSGQDAKSYSQTFADYAKLHRVSGLELPNASAVEYSQIAVIIEPEYGYGHLSMDADFAGTSYLINGMFTTENFKQEAWGYGHDEEVDEVYEYADGRYAFFIQTQDRNDQVYFSEKGILFQMFFPNGSGQGREQAKGLLRAMAQ